MATKKRTYGNFYRLLALLPSGEKEEWIARATGGRTTSLREMTTIEYGEMTRAMRAAVDARKNEALNKLDLARKRLIAAIGGYLEALGRSGDDLPKIKAIARRASGKEEFNKIPLDRLNSLYNAFKNRKTDLLTVKEVDLGCPVKELQVMLEEAVAEEDYELAQKLHERIKEITE